MIISHKYKFIFLKPVKVAGTSMEVTLAKNCGDTDIATRIGDYSNDSDDDKYIHQPKNNDGYFNHMLPDDIRNNIGDKIWKNYFKFTIVRNPWDQAVSRYFWEKSRKKIELLNSITLIKNNLFNPFVYKFFFDNLLSYLQFTFNFFIEHSNINTSNACFYFDSDSNPICDYYMRYEKLEDDYREICKILGLPFEKLLKIKSKQRKSKKHYSRYFNKKTKNEIGYNSKKEINYFGYKFKEK